MGDEKTVVKIEQSDVDELKKLYEKMLETEMGSEPYAKCKQALKEFEEHLGRKYGFIASKIRGVRNLNGEVIPKDNDYLGYQCPHCHKIYTLDQRAEFERCQERDTAEATPKA